jgi:hypothetical protein
VRVNVTDVAAFAPLEVGMHVLALLAAEAGQRRRQLFPSLKMFHAIAGTRRLHRMLAGGSGGGAIIAAWADEVGRFKARRAPYLIY